MGLRAEALRTVDVTSFTRQALRLPSTSVGPFSGLRSSAQPEDLSPSEHRAEVSRQAAAVVESRHVRVDVDFFLASRDLHRWDFASHPLCDLPMSVLLDLLRRGLDPELPSDRLRYCRLLSGGDLLSLTSLAAVHQRPGSLAVSADNIPCKLLRLGGSGIISGVQFCRRSRQPSVMDISVQYAIHRGKAGSHGGSSGPTALSPCPPRSPPLRPGQPAFA